MEAENSKHKGKTGGGNGVYTPNYLRGKLKFIIGPYGCVFLDIASCDQAILTELRIHQNENGYMKLETVGFYGSRHIALHTLGYVLTHKERPPLYHQLAHLCSTSTCLTHVKVASKEENRAMQKCQFYGVDGEVVLDCLCNNHALPPYYCFPHPEEIFLTDDVSVDFPQSFEKFIIPPVLFPPSHFVGMGVLCPICLQFYNTFTSMIAHIGRTHSRRGGESEWVKIPNHPRWTELFERYLQMDAPTQLEAAREEYKTAEVQRLRKIDRERKRKERGWGDEEEEDA